jgi:SAM-dependent methyltransferase
VAGYCSRLRSRFVGMVYADHNRSRIVRRTLAAVLAEMPADGVGLNVGAGGTRLDPRVRNLDIVAGPHIDIVSPAEAMPLPDRTVDLVVTQETLEHVADPFRAMQEIRRVLKPGGRLYLQLPFTIGYHPGPTDFWRFTREGIVRLVDAAGLRCTEVGLTVGASTGFYRICVEYFAVLLSVPLPPLYLPLKAFFAALLYPIKLLDAVTAHSRQVDRVAGGYYVLATRPAPDEERDG